MANILPETRSEVVYSQIYPEPNARGVSKCELQMTEVKGSMFCYIHHLTMVHIIYTILCGRIT